MRTDPRAQERSGVKVIELWFFMVVKKTGGGQKEGDKIERGVSEAQGISRQSNV